MPVYKINIKNERGFKGEARPRNIGASVSRNFTAYDHDTFIENIKAVNEKTDKLTDNLSKIINAKNTAYGLVKCGDDIDILDGEVTVRRALLANNTSSLENIRNINLIGDTTGIIAFDGNNDTEVDVKVNAINDIRFIVSEKELEYI